MVKQLDLKLTLGMNKRRKTESHVMRNPMERGQRFKSRSDPKPPISSLTFFVQSVTVSVGHSSGVKQRIKGEILVL